MATAYTFEDNSCAKTDLRSLSRSPNLRSPTCAQAAVRAIKEMQKRSSLSCNGDGDDGVVRVKIVISKQELKQMLASMGSGRNGSNHHKPRFATMEQMLHLLKRKHMKRADSGKGHLSGKWRPALQSIPEEL